MHERDFEMKKPIRTLICVCLVLCVLSGFFACSRGGADGSDESTEYTTHNYTYPGTIEVPVVSGEIESDTQGTTENNLSNPLLQHVESNILNAETTKAQNNPTKAEETTSAAPKKTVSVTIPAGATMVDAFAILDASGVASFSSLMNTAQNFDFTYYPLIEAQKKTTRAFKLEGYLRAGTYNFTVNSKPEDAIGKLLRSMESSITTYMRNQIASRGYTIDDVITIASIIQRECTNTADMTRVSAIIHNRLAQGMKLEMKSTIAYIDTSVKPYLQTQDETVLNQYNNYYDTNSCAARPAGPICCPGSDAITAALNPAGVDYLYFCVDKDGKYYYAGTPEEHEQNLIAAGLKTAE